MAKYSKWILTDTFPNPLLRVTGQITIAAGQLEYVLMLAYKRASGKGMAVGMADAERLRDVKKLLRELKREFTKNIPDDAANNELAKIVGDIWDVYQRRHTVVHAVFVEKEDGQLARFYSDRPKIRVKAIDYGVEVKKLRALRNDLRARRNELNAFTKKWLLGKRMKKGAR